MDKWYKTCSLIPHGTQTMSKRPSHYGQGCPKYIKSASECYVWDEKDRMYIDYPCALGAVLLGYNKIVPYVESNVFSLPHYDETILAEKLTKIIPCAEMVRFLKTGSEADSAAIRIARSYTKREHIAYCGYHGWHDWIQVDKHQNGGIPKRLKPLVHEFEYNDIDSLIRILKKFPIAAVILEPYIYEAPKGDFLSYLVPSTHKYGALVIFDEIITGFRTKGMSAQKFFKVTPDLATFSKAMANGIPISCVVGKIKYMKELEKNCFVSSTFGGDLIGIDAAIETINFIEKNNVIDHIWKMGTLLKDGFNDIATRKGINARCIGYPCRTLFEFETDELKRYFWKKCLEKGILFGYAQFISYAHKEEDISRTLTVIRRVLDDNCFIAH